MKKITPWIKLHKVSSVVIGLIITLGGYYIYGKSQPAAPTRYVLATVAKGTIISTVAGTGQVSTLDTVDLKPKVSGTVTYIGAVNGQTVATGALIAQLDSSDAAKTVRDAQSSLESAKISLQKLTQPSDALSVLQAQNAITDAQTGKITAASNLAKAYDDSFTTISNAFTDLPNAVNGINDVLYKTTASNQDYASNYADLVRTVAPSVDTYKNDATTKYASAQTAYNANFSDYKATSRYASTTAIEALLNETYDTTKTLAESAKSVNDFLSFVKTTLVAQSKTVPSSLVTQQTQLAGYTTTINADLSALANNKNAMTSDKNAVLGADQSIAEKQASFDKLKAGADPLDVQSSQLSVTQRENALKYAQDTLANYYIRAPFAGVVAKVNVQKGDEASFGTAIATLITKQQIANISLNEIDVAKIKTGEKATVTFDAVDGLSIAGQVSQIDAVGAVTQGVVTYNAQIAFDTQDARIKPGMSVSVSIITAVKQDVLTVPNSALKSSGGVQYVEVPNEKVTAPGGTQGVALSTAPKEQTVTTGMSNDTVTEIISGLAEGDQVVTRTITTGAASTQAPSILNAAGVRGGAAGGGAFRPTGR
jgi:RND family efflux transporter MFP subunit